MSTATAAARRSSGRPVLVALLDGRRVGDVYQSSGGALRFMYDDAWRLDSAAYPLSLSMPLAAREHRHEVIAAYLWGLLPDNDRTLDRYARAFGVSARNPVALLARIGADCAGAVQLFAPDEAARIQGAEADGGRVEWLNEMEIAAELRSVREHGIPGASLSAPGQFSLAGAQPKIALLEEEGRWGRPSGRIPTNRILKPPSGEFRAFAENEHLCLELARELSLGAVASRVAKFGDEIAIVVERFDREKRSGAWVRVHQEDACQALGVMPSRKNESDGGPGVGDIVALLQDNSGRYDEDLERFLRATALNWVLAATDAHAKNYALLHASRGTRLAPFYDILSFLPYADPALHRVRLAMRVGTEYLVRRIGRGSWSALARRSRLSERVVIDNVVAVLEQLPAALERVVERALRDGLDADATEVLRERIARRAEQCLSAITHARGLD